MRPVAGPTRHWLRLILLGLLLHGIAPLASAQERPDRRPGAGGLAGPARGSVPRIAQRGPGGPRAPSGSWLGQDGHDLVGSATALAGNDVQDIHVLLRGLPPGREVHFISVRGLGGGEWQYRTDGPFNPWRAALARTAQAPTADLYLDPYRPEAGRPFAVTIRYDDGSTAEFDLRGGKADPDLRMPRAALQVRWIGQDRQDWVGTGPSVGPDGLQDAHLALAQLSGNVEIRAVAVEGPGGIGWQYGLNPKGLSNAELIRTAGDPSRADLYIAADRVPGGKTLTVTVAYANDKTDRATVVAGRVDPALRMPEPAPLRMASAKVTAQWKGQDGAPETTPGDVHISLSGLPAGRGVAAAALSDSIRGFWSYRASDRVPEFIEPYPRPLAFRRGTSPTRAELFFPPYRDEAGATLTLRLVFDDGTTAVTQVSGGPCDLGLRAPRPERTTGTARPGDDLHALVGRFGTVRLARGEYRLTRPLVLNRPVTLTAEPGTTLRFAQEPGDAPWTTAIKVHHGHTTLEGFAVRFAGPIRWDQQVSFGPAVIGTTDDRDQEPARVLADLAFRKLDLESPPAASSWEEATRLMRLVTAANGRVEDCVLRGGMIEFRNGPWAFVGNEHRGTPPGTFAWAVFSGHHVHDLVVRGNTAHAVAPAGKTWRFLVLTTSGSGDEVRDNRVADIGPRDNDTVPATNAPEVILTEAYQLHFEGRPAALSADRRVVAIVGPQGEPARVGSVASVLSGPHAGQWVRVAQPIDATRYLLEAPLPEGAYDIALATGFVGEVFEGNTVDSRGSTHAVNLVLAGNHYGTRVVNNHLLGAGETLRFTACPTEQPRHWGWSHAPVLGGLIQGNTFEDADRGVLIAVEHNKDTKTGRGRVYLTATVQENTATWSAAFLGRKDRTRAAEGLIGFIVGEAPALDPGELVLTAQGNRARVPAGTAPGAVVRMVAGLINGQRVLDRTVVLPPATPAISTGSATAPPPVR